MTRSLMATLRRATRLMKPARKGKAARKIRQAATGLVVRTVLAPLAALAPKPVRKRKAAPRKAAMPKSARSLGVVLGQLRLARSLVSGAPSAPARTPASPRIPAGAQYLARQHRSTAGARSYKLYLPASQPRRPAGLILMLHGCNQSPDDFALGTHMNAVAEKHGLAVAYPAQTKGHNAADCWNWFIPANQARGAGEPAILASLARKLMREFDLGRESVYVAGLSAGGAMAAILADVYPDVFSAAGVHSGLARGSARNMLSAISAMHNGSTPETFAAGSGVPTHPVRRIIFHGDADSTVHPSNAGQIVAAAMGKGARPATVTTRSVQGRDYARSRFAGADGAVQLELWMLKGAGHAWSGGRAAGSYTDRKGPDASAQMVRFFLNRAA